MKEDQLEEFKQTARGLLLDNLPLKALSLLLAALLWHQVASQQTVQREVTIPVEFVNMPLDLEIVNDYVRQVDVVVRSNRGGSIIEERQLSVVLDLNDARAGVEVIQLTPDHVSRAKGLEILRINPTQVRLELENTLTKMVDIEPQLEGAPAEGFELTEVKVVPPQTVVSGPESRINNVEHARTGTVNIGGASSTVTAQTFVELDEPRVRIADETSSVNVIAVIEEKRRPVKIPGVKVRVLPQDADVRLMDQTVELRGTVPVSFDETLDSAKFEAVVDAGPLPASAEAQEVKPKIVIPTEFADVFRLESQKPEAVRVRKAS